MGRLAGSLGSLRSVGDMAQLWIPGSAVAPDFLGPCHRDQRYRLCDLGFPADADCPPSLRQVPSRPFPRGSIRSGPSSWHGGHRLHRRARQNGSAQTGLSRPPSSCRAFAAPPILLFTDRSGRSDLPGRCRSWVRSTPKSETRNCEPPAWRPTW